MPGPNQTATSYGYEPDSDLASLTHNYPGAATDLVYAHTYSAAGRLLTTTTSDPFNRYAPPELSGTQTYAAANALNQYPSVTPIGGSATTLGYDLNGNLTGDGSSTYTYDATNRLNAISGLINASYAYDALDRRMSKTASNVTTRFLHAGSDEIAEYSSAGVLLRRYVPGPGVDERAVLIDSSLVTPPASALRFPHTDRLGSVVSVTDSTGNVSERFAYDAFGRSNSAMSGYPYRFTGQRLDSETGLMFYKARVYSQSLGRFLQTDPIGTKDDLNMYAYVGNDPVNFADPTGMCQSCPQDELIGPQTYADMRSAGNRFDTAAIDAFAQYHPAGAPIQTYRELEAGDYSGVAWSLGTAGALKGLSYAGSALKFAGRYAGDGFQWARRAFGVACCFVEGTLVSTKDGLTPIEKIRVGDLVLSRDEKTGETAYKPVTALIPKHERIVWTVTLAIGGGKSGAKEVTLRTTDDHPWRLATGVWVQTQQLGLGMRIVRADGAPADIVSVFNTGKNGAVYNLEVADFHTYFVGADRVWVHNSCAISRYLQGGKSFGSFADFRSAFGSAGKGRAWHHIVEQRNEATFGAQAIHNENNLVSLSNDVHDQISAYYSSKQPFTGGLTVRDWLSSQSFDEQYEYGVRIMRQFGGVH